MIVIGHGTCKRSCGPIDPKEAAHFVACGGWGIRAVSSAMLTISIGALKYIREQSTSLANRQTGLTPLAGKWRDVAAAPGAASRWRGLARRDGDAAAREYRGGAGSFAAGPRTTIEGRHGGAAGVDW